MLDMHVLDKEPEVPQPDNSEEDKRKQEESKQQQEKERLLEEARKKHVRPWDIGKEGVKEHYEMTQDEWVEKKRNERAEEFAPPQIYSKREFRSSVKTSNSGETDKSLKFTTKKFKTKKGRREKVNVEAEVSDTLEDIYQSVAMEPTPIENLCEEADFDDHNKTMHEKIYETETISSGSTRKGVEIAPPPTYEYYGPSDSKKRKYVKSEVNIQNSIEAGLKFLRKQVEDKQKTSKRRSDYTSPF